MLLEAMILWIPLFYSITTKLITTGKRHCGSEGQGESILIMHLLK